MVKKVGQVWEDPANNKRIQHEQADLMLLLLEFFQDAVEAHLTEPLPWSPSFPYVCSFSPDEAGTR